MRDYKVLILEDSPTAMNDLTIKLRKLIRKDHIFAATDFESAVQVIETENIDIAFIDLAIPRKSGMDFIVDYLKAHERTESIPVIVTTSSSPKSLLKTSLKPLTFRYLHKPIQVVDLEEAISSYYEQSKMG